MRLPSPSIVVRAIIGEFQPRWWLDYCPEIDDGNSCLLSLRSRFPSYLSQIFLNLPCAFRKSYPDILVMQSTEDGHSDNPADPLHGAP